MAEMWSVVCPNCEHEMMLKAKSAAPLKFAGLPAVYWDELKATLDKDKDKVLTILAKRNIELNQIVEECKKEVKKSKKDAHCAAMKVGRYSGALFRIESIIDNVEAE